MNIFVFIANLNAAGAQRTTLNLVNSWARNKHNVTLVIGGQDADYQSYLHLINENVSSIFLNKSRTIFCLMYVVLVLIKNKFDIIFAPSPESSALLMLAKKLSLNSSKAVVRESNFRSFNDDRNLTVRYLFYKFAYRSADRVIALSKGVKEDLIKRYKIKDNLITVIYNPIDFSFINQEMFDKAFLSDRLKNKDDSLIHLIAVGRLVKQKGFDLLIKSMALLNDTNIHLSIFGEGEDRNYLSSLIKQNKLEGEVFLEGYTVNPYVNIKASDIFILSSRWEGFGHVIVESMACEVPVIAFDCKSGPNEIIKNDLNGVLCKAESCAILAEEIKKLAYDSDKQLSISKAALSHIKKYDSELISSEYIEIFKKAL